MSLTIARRRVLCIHEAAHAVVFALSGTTVYNIVVADEGAEKLDDTGRSRRHDDYTERQGVCEVIRLNLPLPLLSWDQNSWSYQSDTDFKKQWLCSVPAASLRGLYQLIRGQVCAMIAGPVSEAILSARDDEVLPKPNFNSPNDDLHKAWAWCEFLLPQKEEYDYLIAETFRTLRDQHVWQSIRNLADVLEVSGNLSNDEIPFLPEPRKNWPRTRRSLNWSR